MHSDRRCSTRVPCHIQAYIQRSSASGLAGRELRDSGGSFQNLSRVFILRANQLLTPAESGQHYVFLRAAGSPGPDLSLSGFVLLSLQDGSGALNGEARYRIARDLEGVATFDLFYGPIRSEFGSLPVTRVFRLSLRYSF